MPWTHSCSPPVSLIEHHEMRVTRDIVEQLHTGLTVTISEIVSHSANLGPARDEVGFLYDVADVLHTGCRIYL